MRPDQPPSVRFRRLLLALAVSCLFPSDAWSEEIVGKDVFGWIERVKVSQLGLELEAKLDTGADHSSLDASNIRRVRKGEKRYVRFSVLDPESGEAVELRRPFVRKTRIKRHSGESQGRYVVEMEICIGTHRRKVEISLVDRSVFNYPMLLGRSALQGIAVVDPELLFTTAPACELEEEGS